MIRLPKSVVFGDNLKFSQLYTQDNGSKSIYINYEGQALHIQTPKLITPFGLSKYNPTGGSDVVGAAEKYSLQLSLKGNTESSRNFIKFLESMQMLILDEGVKNSKEWFKKTYSKEVLQELLTQLIVYPKNKEGDIVDTYPPTFKLSIPVVDGLVKCDCFDDKGDAITVSNISKSSEVSAIVKIQGLWFAGSKFGLSCKVVQLRVQQPTRINGYSFNDDCEDEAGENKYIESSDDEDELDTIETPCEEEKTMCEEEEEMQFTAIDEEEHEKSDVVCENNTTVEEDGDKAEEAVVENEKKRSSKKKK